MNDYVEIVLRRNRGWPWPEDSWGLMPIYGEDGWCRVCGVPQHPQSGSIVLQSRGLTVSGAWVPNWQFDVYCMESEFGARAEADFGLTFRSVRSPKGELDAVQVIIDSSQDQWFRPGDLDRLISPIHGVASEECAVCGIVRWMPVGMDTLPPPPVELLASEPPVVASPEWFGAGYRSFRQIIWRRDVAVFMLSVGPKDFRIQELRDR